MFIFKLKRCLGSARLGRLRSFPLAKMICYFLITVAALEFILLNVGVLYVYRVISNEFSQVKGEHNDDSFLQKLHNNMKIRNLVSYARDGGFVSLLQDSVDRLYLVKDSNFKNATVKDTKEELKEFYSFGLDVSHSGEATFIYRKILSRKDFPYQFMVVDIGANDGFLASNSFNFIQLGWNAVLVEPQLDQVRLAKRNLNRYIQVNREPPHLVNFVQAAISSKDGHVSLALKAEHQESHVVLNNIERSAGDFVIQVPSISVKTLALKYSIPKKFGILSIDAEGMGLEILEQWFNLGFTPAYVIFEVLHIHWSRSNINKLFQQHSYVFIGKRGWNSIYEHRPPPHSE